MNSPTKLLTLDVHPVAVACLHHLVARLGDTLPTDITARAWYNGRERGISLEVGACLTREKTFIFFSECKNSDSIVVDSWQALATMNGPRFDDEEYEEAYRNRTYFAPGQYDRAVSFILGAIKGQVDFDNGQAVKKGLTSK